MCMWMLALVLACRTVAPPQDAPADTTEPLAEPVDSDGDGWADAEEEAAGADPYDPDDRPYEGGWHKGDCRHQVVGNGNEVGDIAEDFALVDQHGDLVHLHDFCDRVVLLQVGTPWHAPSRVEAMDLQEQFIAAGDRGLFPILLVPEAPDGDPADPDDAIDWAADIGAGFPVLADPGWAVSDRYHYWRRKNLPSHALLGRGAEVLLVDDYADPATIEAALAED